ncbi:hypothetical protein GJ496_000329 [Pomphorhynchus laevis]|nr:hypothetical protein GJ496_000329 [Pomphorhynchus laevis]
MGEIPVDKRISNKAIGKMVLHSIKYHSGFVNGICIGNENEITDCFALFHLTPACSPLLDVAIDIISNYCEQTSTKIVGYYHSNSNYKDINTPIHCAKLLQKIVDKSAIAEPIHIQIDIGAYRKDLNSPSRSIIKMFTLQNNKLVSVDSDWKLDNGSESFDLINVIKRAQQIPFNDFDGWFEDFNLDPINEQLDCLF